MMEQWDLLEERQINCKGECELWQKLGIVMHASAIRERM